MSGQRRGSAGTGSAARPAAKKKGRWSSGWRLWLKRFTLLGVVGCVLAVVAFAVAYARTDIPDPNEGFQSQTTYVYYAGGEKVLGRFAEQNRTSIDLSEVPVHVQDAVIAAEDRSFWTNRGLDPKGILRAAFNNARGGDTQGASTITQQYVKVFYLSQERTLTRKAKEAILSVKLQQEMDKKEILEGYLNTIYFGRGAYGIEAAARAYFAIPAGELSVEQGAALAAVINSPNQYDPAEGEDAAQKLTARYRYVLDGMAEMSTLPATYAVPAGGDHVLPEFPEVPAQSQYGGQRGHVLRMVRTELRALGFSDSEIDGGGLRVTTTFTRQAMRAAAEGVAQERPEGLEDLHVAVASVDPRDGGLRGLFAGQDYLDSQLNWAVAGGAPGSTFKPFALATALKEGYALDSTFDGSSPLEIGGTEFNNQGEGAGRSYGRISLLRATEDSVNTAYVEMVDSIPDGAAKVHQTAIDMGVPVSSPGFEANLSNVLGSATISPTAMAGAYGTIASGGVAHKVHVVTTVTDSSGEVLHEHRGEGRRVLPEDVAADTSYALEMVTERGTGTNADTIGRPVAGKTGTATTDGGRVRSSWFVGFTPQLSTAVMYVRGDGNQPLDGYMPTFYGGQYPARTWAAVMEAALEGSDVLELADRADIDHTAEDHSPFPTFTPTPTPPSTPQPSQTPTPTETPSPTEEPSPTEPAAPTEGPPPEGETPAAEEPPEDVDGPPPAPPDGEGDAGAEGDDVIDG